MSPSSLSLGLLCCSSPSAGPVAGHGGMSWRARPRPRGCCPLGWTARRRVYHPPPPLWPHPAWPLTLKYLEGVGYLQIQPRCVQSATPSGVALHSTSMLPSASYPGLGPYGPLGRGRSCMPLLGASSADVQMNRRKLSSCAGSGNSSSPRLSVPLPSSCPCRRHFGSV